MKNMKKDYSKIGGWLWLIALLLITSPVSAIWQIITHDVKLLHDGTMALLTNPETYAYHVLWQPLLLSEFIFRIMTILLSPLMMYLFLMKKKRFILVYASWMILCILAVILFVLGRVWIYHSYDVPMDSVYYFIWIGVIEHLILLVCFYRSSRVKNTFVRT